MSGIGRFFLAQQKETAHTHARYACIRMLAVGWTEELGQDSEFLACLGEGCKCSI